VTGIGFRPRGAVPLSHSDRVLISAISFYYPKTSTGDAWVLTRPMLSYEHEFTNGYRAWLTGGVIYASCVDALFDGKHSEEGSMRGLWENAGIGGSLPLGRSWQLFAEASMVLDGPRPAGRDYIGGPPVVAFLGVNRRL
jgi:hypothetical protein